MNVCIRSLWWTSPGLALQNMPTSWKRCLAYDWEDFTRVNMKKPIWLQLPFLKHSIYSQSSWYKRGELVQLLSSSSSSSTMPFETALAESLSYKGEFCLSGVWTEGLWSKVPWFSWLRYCPEELVDGSSASAWMEFWEDSGGKVSNNDTKIRLKQLNLYA